MVMILAVTLLAKLGSLLVVFKNSSLSAS